MNDDKLSADLQVTLIKWFTLGFLDAMAGFEVMDDDLLVGIDGAAIWASALTCIAKAEDMIHANYLENPQTVHDAVYDTGRRAYAEVERRAIQRN